MFNYNLKNKKGVLIIPMFEQSPKHTIRINIGNWDRNQKYAIYNTRTKELSFVYSYSYLKTKIFDYSCNAFVMEENEYAIVMNVVQRRTVQNGETDYIDTYHCYYMDVKGNLSECIGGKEIYDNIKVKYINECDKSSFFDYFINDDFDDSDDFDINDFVIKDGGINNKNNPNGKEIQFRYPFFDRINCKKNLIICYEKVKSGGDWANRLFGLYDENGMQLTPNKYTTIYRGTIKELFIVVKVNEKFGLVTTEGTEILPPVYDDDIRDCNGKIAVMNNGELIRIGDLTVLYKTEYKISMIKDGWMRVYNHEEDIGLLDEEGRLYEFYDEECFARFALRKKYSNLGHFSNGLLPVFGYKRGYGYVDINSKEVIECKYFEISDFENGRARVRYDCEYGYIDIKGRMIVKNNNEEVKIPSLYDWAYDFHDGICVVQKKRYFGAIDEYLNEIIPCRMRSKSEVEYMLAKMRLYLKQLTEEEYKKELYNLLPPIRYEENGLFGYKQQDGAIICPPILHVREFVEGMAAITIDNKVGFINERLELVIEPKYTSAHDFSEGLALVYDYGASYINKCGDTVFKLDHHYQRLGDFEGGLAKYEYHYYQVGRDSDDDKMSKFMIGYESLE